MNSLVSRMASPLSRRWGLVLALLALVMTASPLVATLWLQISSSVEGYYDYDTSNVVLGITWALGYLGIVPLLFAAVALIRRPVKPSWLMPVAIALALFQPLVHVLSAAQIVAMDLGSALLALVLTGCSAGVLAVGLRGVDGPSHIGMALLIAVGVSIAATAALAVLTSAVVSLTIAILLGVAVAQSRVRDGRAGDSPATENRPADTSQSSGA